MHTIPQHKLIAQRCSAPAVLKPPEPAVALYAEQFIKARAPGALAVLLAFVASGTYRGLKDTKTPLYASIGSTLTNLVLHLLFIYGFGWGVAGSGLAMSMANWVSCGTLTLLLIR
jgi:Na+-driven multidrug efflux pump